MTSTLLTPPTQPELDAKKQEMATWAKERLADPNTLIVDVETTGILARDPETEIVQIAMIDRDGRPVLAALVNPGRPIPLVTQKIHGIDDRAVKDCPPWSVIGDLAAGTMEGKHIVCFNAGFDVHLITHLFQKHKVRLPDFEVSCAMEAYAAWVGQWSKSKNDYKWQSLPKLAFGTAHDALTDCASTLLLLKKMAGDFSDEPNPEDVKLDF